MKKTKKIVHITAGLLVLLMFMPQTFAGYMGFGPTEVVGSNRRNTLVIGTMSLINDYDVPKYGVIKLTIPYINEETWQPIPKEQRNLRVVCKDCGHSMVRYEAISNYSYPDSPLVGTCDKCSSKNLIFYELIPRDEFQQMSLEGADAFELGKNGNTYTTTKKIPSGATCNINILYNASTSYIKENEGKYWEVRPKATLVEELDSTGVAMLSGIGIRTLIEFKMPLFLDVPDVIEKGKEFTVKVTYGNLEGTWREIPANVLVSFQGVSKPIDEKGYVTFIAPTTREDYSYDITVEGDKYLSDVKSVTPITIEEEDAGGISSLIPFIGIGTGLIVIIAVCFYLFRHKRKKETENE